MKRTCALALTILLGLFMWGCEDPGGTTTCPDTLCNGECVSLLVDPLNCGACGIVCGSDERCEAGSCASACPAGLTSCLGSCVNTSHNPENCGSCGNRCDASQHCENGVCRGGDCPAGLDDCGGQCVDTENDPSHCGRCDNRCDATCVDGECLTSCPDGLTDCSGSCVDTGKDETNCGGCGTACADGETCNEGVCTLRCPEGFIPCDGTCVDAQSDRAHCGRCGNFCNDGQVCNDGSCSAEGCDPGLTDCSSSCVDTNNDPSHCGRCDNRCPDGQACTSGTCGVLCPDSQTECSGECVDLDEDESHCGSCTTVCRADQTCHGGHCTCGGSRTECSGACVDMRTDPSNCGACGTSCTGSEACVSSVCTVSCPAGTEACSGYCVDTDSDRTHCGSCDNGCSDGQSCVGGVCTAGGGTAGDTCTDPITVTGGGVFTGSTTSASADYEGACGGTTGRDVVFQYTLTETTDVFVASYGSAFDTVVYARSSCGGGADIECNDDSEIGSADCLQSEINMLSQAAGTYYIFLDGYSSFDSGNYELQVYMSEPSARAGDACGEPLHFDINSATTVDGNTCSFWLIDFRDDDRACGRGTAGYDMVYYFEITDPGSYTFETCGTADWDTILELRTACNDSASSVSCNDDGCSTGTQSSITATLTAGWYYLWLDGFSEDACGSFDITVTRP